MAGGRLGTDAVYLGLTRPAMIGGVTYSYVTLNGMVCLISFVQTGNPAIIIVLGPFLHLIGYYLCLKEPRMMELAILKFGKFTKCRNKTVRHFGNNSYDIG